MNGIPMQSSREQTEKSSGAQFPLVLACFFLSGFAGLVYETAWSDEFALFLGATELAVSVVLGAYMAGLAFGATLAGRFAAKIKRPLLAYGVLELGIGVAGVVIPFAIRLVGHIKVALFSGQGFLSESDWLLTSFDIVSSFAILMVPTALMGATLPILVRCMVRRDSQIGPRIGVLYTVNTLGASAGAFTTAFYLLPLLGLGHSVLVAVFINFIVFCLVIPYMKDRLPSLVESKTHIDHGARWVLPVMTWCGIFSFSMEVFWTRVLSHLLGGSVYAFGTMLSTFLVGIALGAGLIGRFSRTQEKAARLLPLVLAGIALSSLIAFELADFLPQWVSGVNKDEMIWTGTLLSVMTLLPGAVFSGATYPLAVRLLSASPDNASGASGLAYAWNTIGAIGGAILATFFLLPVLGFSGTIRTLSLLTLLLAIAISIVGKSGLFWNWRQSYRQNLSMTLSTVFSIAGLVFLGLGYPKDPDRVFQFSPLTGNYSESPVTYMGVGKSATVMVTQMDASWRLSTNGLPESIFLAPGERPRRMATARWLSLLGYAGCPGAQNMFVIGLGSGVSVESMPTSIENIQVVELEPEIYNANVFMKDFRRIDPLADPRVHVHFNDARSALMLTESSFDIIVSQPSHPWTSAASHLYTKEFFKLVDSRLSPKGVFVQWIGIRFVDASLLKTLVATLNDVFEDVEVYSPEPGGILFIASNQPLLNLDKVRQALQDGRDQWREMGVNRPEDIFMARDLDDQGSREFSDGATINRDRFNILKIRSPKILGNGLTVDETDNLIGPVDALNDLPDGLDKVYIFRQLLEQGHFGRARMLMDQETSQSEKDVMKAILNLAQGNPTGALDSLMPYLSSQMDHPEFQAAIVFAARPSLMNGDTLPGFEVALSKSAKALVQAWSYQKQKDWDAIKALDDELTIDDHSSPFFRPCTQLRILWRLNDGNGAQVNETRNLMGGLLNLALLPNETILWIQCAMALDDNEMASAAFSELSQELVSPTMRPVQKRKMLGTVRRLVYLQPQREKWFKIMKRVVNPSVLKNF